MSMDIACLKKTSRGVTTLLVVGFLGIFTLVMGTISSYVFQQAKYGRALYAREQALTIAEAGLEYYKWFLARTSSALDTGSGLVSPYTYTVSDPEGGVLGSAEITATPKLQCGKTQWVDITSVGTAASDVRFPRTLSARYMKPSIGEYAFVTDTGVYATAAIVGPMHANVGVHMNGTNNAKVTAGQSTWNCTSSFGCSGQGGQPSPGTKPGVFGTGSGHILWDYPVSQISFSTIASKFSDLKAYAQADGIMLNPTSVTRDGVQQGSTFSSVGGTDQKGFHVVFKQGSAGDSNGVVDIYRVTATSPIASFNTVRGYLFGSNFCTYYLGGNNCENSYDYPDIGSETLVASNIAVPSGCALIYSEAKTWISGTVKGKVTLIANDSGSFKADIIIGGTTNAADGYVAYDTTDGTTGFTAVAERSVRIAHRVPDATSIRGTYIAQGGYFGRDFYYYTYNVDPYYGGALSSYRLRNSLTTTGAIVSAFQAATAYTDSGFQNRTARYDLLQAYDPPPFTPSAYVDYGLELWREE